MNAVDSSVAVAACASWHESHGVAQEAVARGTRLVAHAALETFSVLTRLPAPHRVAAPIVAAFLDQAFADDPLTLDARALRALVEDLARRGVAGGAVYDGLIARTAAAHGATLLTLDRRAEDTYRRCGVRYRVLQARAD